MRILFVHNKYQQPGGEDVAVANESALLQQKGHSVETVFFQNSSRVGWLNKFDAARKALYNTHSYRRIAVVIEEFQPHLIHAHNLFFEASPSVLFAASRKKIPVVLTLHNYRLICANALLLRNNKPCELCVNGTFPIHGIKYRCYRNSMTESGLVTGITGIHKLSGTWKAKVDRYIALTEFAKTKILSSSLHLSPEKLIVTPNFIYDPGTGLSEREDFFLFVGRLAKEKGVYQLLEAVSKLPNVKLMVIGDGPEKEALQQQFNDTPNIIFTGNMDKESVLSAMKKCKALIFPSLWYEGLPFTIIEAFATGTPVLASRLGSMQELIQDGINGYYFEPSPKDIQKKILQFDQAGINTQQALYTGARKTYLEKYHPDIHYVAIMSIYNSILQERSS